MKQIHVLTYDTCVLYIIGAADLNAAFSSVAVNRYENVGNIGLSDKPSLNQHIVLDSLARVDCTLSALSVNM